MAEHCHYTWCSYSFIFSFFHFIIVLLCDCKTCRHTCKLTRYLGLIQDLKKKKGDSFNAWSFLILLNVLSNVDVFQGSHIRSASGDQFMQTGGAACHRCSRAVWLKAEKHSATQTFNLSSGWAGGPKWVRGITELSTHASAFIRRSSETCSGKHRHSQASLITWRFLTRNLAH